MALLHVTGRRDVPKTASVPEAIRRMSPAERLRSILEKRQLHPCSTSYSHGQPVVCFTEGDEGYLAELVVEKGHAPWGVILDQDRIVQRGVKPVRYVHESDVPPADDRWRNVRYNHAGGLDWYWEREWRWRGDEALGLQPSDVLAVVVEDPTWPGPAMVPELQPDGDVLPAPAVPEWINGIERFLWVPEKGRFLRIGPYEVPPWERVHVARGHTIASEERNMHDWIEASSVVFTDEEDPQELYQRLLHTVTESFGKWLSDGGN